MELLALDTKTGRQYITSM